MLSNSDVHTRSVIQICSVCSHKHSLQYRANIKVKQPSPQAGNGGLGRNAAAGSTGESSLVRMLRELTGPTQAAVKSFSCGSLEYGSGEGPGGPREHKPMARADNQTCVGQGHFRGP